MRSVTVHEAKTHLSRLLVAVAEGEEIEVCRGDVPMARLVPVRPAQPSRPAVGVVTSLPVHCAPDCFEPADDEEVARWGLS